MDRRKAIKLLGKGAMIAGAVPYLSSCEINPFEPGPEQEDR